MKKMFLSLLALTLSCSTVKRRESELFYDFTVAPNLGKYMEVHNDLDAPYESIIRIKDHTGQFVCTGFVIDGQYAVTAAHCVTDDHGRYSKEIYTIYNSKDQFVSFANAVGASRRMDYAVIRGNFKRFERTLIASSENAMLPKSVYISCGYPMGQKQVYCVPLLTQSLYAFQVIGYGSLYPGMSGGPVVDPQTNTVVGLNSAMTPGPNSMMVISPLVGLLGAFNLD